MTARITLALLVIAAEGEVVAAPPSGYDFAAYATGTGCGALTMSGKAYTDSFDSSKGTYDQTKQLSQGLIGSSGNVNLSGNVVINGPVFALNTAVGTCTNGAPGITISGKASATGGYIQLNAAPVFVSVPIVAPGTTDLRLTSSVSLPPGSYGNLSVSGGATLTLAPGAYNINSLNLSGGSQIAISPQGQAIVNVAGNQVSQPIQFSGGSAANSPGVPLNLQLIYGGTLPITVSGGSGTYGVLYAPNSAVTLTGDWFGAMVVETFNDSGGSALHYDRHLAIPPTITGGIAPAPNAAGWNNSNVTVTFTCGDGILGIASCTSPVSVTTEGVNQSFSGTAANRAGFSATTAVTVNLDKTPPSVAITSPATGITVNTPSLAVSGTTTDALSGVASVTCQGKPATLSASTFSCTVTLASGPNIITVQATDKAGNTAVATITATLVGLTITDFNPKSAPVGTLVNVTGNGFVPTSGAVPQVIVNKQGGGTLTPPLSSFTNSALAFVIPAGAATGPLTANVNGASASSASPLTIVPSSTFTITALPPTANLIQGQSVAYSVQLSSASGFNQLAQLSVTGVPSGVTASFSPASITAGQTSILNLSAPLGQATGTTALSISAAATVNGFPVTQSGAASLSVVASTTTLLGRTVVSDSLQTPLAGVTIKTLGLDGNGNTTGCTSESTTSDAAGNFALTNLPMQCTGPQLISFDGTTATAPPGKYAGVNLVFMLSQGQVTASPVLVHLPRIDNVETFLVTQNASSNQTHAFASIPGLSVTVYAGTTFTMPDGTQPNPFPLAAVQVPVDRLPDAKPFVPTMIRAFIVAFQPANAATNEPVAVYFPNTLNTPPGTDMALMTLDPTHGQMVPYGTGAVSSDGTQIVPDPDPAHPGHLYGLIHFDWHGPMPPPPPMTSPAPPGAGTGAGGGPASGPGPGPGGGSGPGGGNGGNNGGGGNGGNGGNGGGNGGNGGGGGGCTTCPCTSSIQDYDPIKLLAEPGAQAGDPVDLYSGIQIITNTDISISGARGPLAVVRTYRSLSSNPGPFGIGTGHNYGLQLDTSGLIRSAEGIINLVMPDGNEYPFFRTITGTFINTAIPVFAGAVMSNPSSGVYKLRYRNGTTYVFQSLFGALEASLTAIIDSNGNTITITLSQPLQITEVTDPVGRSLTFAYDGSNRITSITDPIGRIVQYSYNTQGSLATFTDAAGGVTRYTYDSGNNLLTLTDARGIVQAQNTLDANGRVVQQVRPDGGVLTFSYVLMNPLVATSPVIQAQVTDSQSVQATYRFNPNGFVTDVTATQGQTRQIVREPGTNLMTSVVEAASTATYTYDGNGNVLTSTDATGLTTQFTYDPVFNKVTTITDPLGNLSRFTYDTNGNLLTSTDADGNATSYQYDPTGLLTQSTDALGQRNRFTYDSFGNLASATDPLGNTTSYTYDEISRPAQTRDSLGRLTSFTYDPLGRLLTRTDAKSGVTTFAYDPDGNVLSMKDARTNTTTFTYDVMNRLATRTDPLGQTDTRTYDTNGNLVTFVDRRGQTSRFTYDNLNRLTGESYADATVARSYDVLGRLAQVNDSAAGVFAFSYDLAGRLLSSSTPIGTVNYAYDGRGAMASRQVAGQPALSYSYDPAGNLTSAALPQASASFTYNPRNQLSNITRPNGVSSAYTYDADARLLTLTHAAGASTIDAESYGYDSVGNRYSHSTSIGQSLVTQPTANLYNANNQLTLFGSVPDSYDANGNLVREGTTTAYTWDGRNRLKSIITAAGQTTNFSYDFAGNLIAQADSGSSLNLTKSFVLDNVTNVAYESASDGTSYSVVSGRSIDSHFAIAQSSGQVLYGLSDAINSTVATTDQTGAIKSLFLYDPFGQTTTTGTYPFQFTGRMPISSTAYYYRARFYNSQTGRFISEDPAGFTADINLYRYVNNNPSSARDPLGLGPGTCLRWIIVAGKIVCAVWTGEQPPPPPPEPPPIVIPIPGPPNPPGGPEPPTGGPEPPPEPEPIPIPSPSFCPTPPLRPLPPFRPISGPFPF